MVDLSRRNFIRAKNVSTPPAIRLPWTADEALFTRGCTPVSYTHLTLPTNREV